MTSKKYMLSSVIAILFSAGFSHAQGQTAQDSVVFDGATWHFRHYPRVVKEGTLITVVYDGVNPFITKSGLVSKSINKSYDDGSSVFTALKLASSGETKTDDAAEKAQDTTGKSPKVNDLLSDSKTADKKQKRAMVEKKKKMEKQGEVHELLSKKIEGLRSVDTDLGNIKTAINEIGNLMQTDTCISLAKAQAYNRSRAQMIADIQARLPEGAKNPKEIRHSFDTLLSEIITGLSSIQSTITMLGDINDKLKKLQPSLDFEKVIDTLKVNTLALAKTYSGDNLDKMKFNITNTVNDYITATSSEFKVHGDTILAATGDYLSISDPKFGIQPFTIKTYNGTRVDFSLGILATMGDVNGWQYSINKVNDSTSYVLTNKVPKQILFSPVGFMHVYTTRKSNHVWMASFGAAPDLSTLQNSKFLLGFSYAGFASNDVARRFIFSAGMACGGADVLKAKYLEKTRTPDFNFHSFGNISESDLTDKAFKVGWYMAISWNLGGLGH